MRYAALLTLAIVVLGLGMISALAPLVGLSVADLLSHLASLCAVTGIVATLVVLGCVAVYRDHVGSGLPTSRFSERGYAALTRCSG